MKILRTLIVSLSIASAVAAGATAVDAFNMSSTNYKVDNAAINSFGGDSSSANYQLTTSGGEPFIGAGSSENYRFNAGYVASLEHSITLTLDNLAVSIPAITPGTSQTATSSVSVFTDAAGYLLSARQDGDLRHTADPSASIPVVDNGGTVGTPVAWTEGTTKGLGFTLTAGTSLEGKWGTNPNYNYAAFPTADTTIHDKPNYQNTYDANTIQYRLDVAGNQIPGTYRTYVTYNATVKP